MHGISKQLDHISVCICTYRRPALLERLLDELSQQETEGRFSYSIVVADNDAAESAKTIVLKIQTRASLEITYCTEGKQNIARARNKALAHARGDFITFIDDDEFPAKDWLLRLYKTCIDYKVDGVLGPVKPYFEQSPPSWIIKGRFYDRPRHETGFVINWNEGRTGNVLLRSAILKPGEEAFKTEFGSGGEDRDFFKRMICAGRIFVWCDEAVAYESVPPARWRRSFMLKRALLRGKASLIDPSSRRTRIVRSVFALPTYALALPLMLALGHHRFMKYLVKTFDHLGRLLAFLGLDLVKENYVTE